MNRRALVIVLLAPLATAGTCGSVLQGYPPLQSTYVGDARWTLSAEGVDVSTDQLVGGPDFAGLSLALTNRGSSPMTVEGIDIRVGGVRRPWAPATPVEIAPGASAAFRASWTGSIGGSKAVIELRLTSPEPRTVFLEYQR